MIIKPLSDISFDDLFAAFSEAFRDYERTWTKEEFQKMLYRRGYVPDLSFGAFDGPQLISFTLNGIGNFNGIRTAYDTGTGTVEEYRGKGLVTKIFHESIPYLQEAGIAQYLLEVLQQNEKAVSIYTRLGFRIEREFNYFIQQVDEIQFQPWEISKKYSLQGIDFMHEQMMSMWDFQPSWQNSFEAIYRKQSDFRILGVYYEKEIIGYGIIEPASGDIAQLAVRKDHRRKGIGSVLLKRMAQDSKAGILKIINTERKTKDFTSFLSGHNIPVSGTQFEMIKDLSC